MMSTKIYLLAVFVFFISCSTPGRDDKNKQSNPSVSSKKSQVIDSLPVQKKIETTVKGGYSKGIDSLLFKGNCTVRKDNELNTKSKAIYQKYFSVSQLLDFKITSFCKDSINESSKLRCLDYLNGKQLMLRFNYSDSVVALNCLANFRKDFITTSRRVDFFFCLKPGFIAVLQKSKIFFILINDCGGQRSQFVQIKKYVKNNFPQANYLISRCGLNLEG